MNTRFSGNTLSLPRRRWLASAITALLTASALALSPHARARVFLSVNIAPPLLPVYEQPPIPGPGYEWVPGYWAYGESGYYWVPGTWVLAPYTGALWTPGYWGWSNNAYVFNEGYWGLHVGYYGGINYGFGYTGIGYYGGYWNHGVLFYNSAFNRFGGVRITNVYNRTVINNVTVNRFSFNGPGGVRRAPTRQELAFSRERHFAPLTTQVRQRELASRETSLRASVNHGSPPILATARAGSMERANLNERASADARTSANARASASTRTNSRAIAADHRAQVHQTRAEARARFASERAHFKQRREAIRETRQREQRALIAEHVRAVHDHHQSAAERAAFKQRREAIRETSQRQHRQLISEHTKAVHERNRAFAETRHEQMAPRHAEHAIGNRPAPRGMIQGESRGPFHAERGGGRAQPTSRPKDHGRER
jgi:hypothetical protein